RSDDEVLAIVRAWRTAHPRITAFWELLARCARSSIATGKPVQVSAAPRIVTSFDGYALKITLPNNRIINYPCAHLVSSEKFLNGAREIESMYNTPRHCNPQRTRTSA